MPEIYAELSKIDPNVMVYGDPWTGGTSAVLDDAVKAGKGTVGYGYGAFDDDFREAIKGAEFGGFKQGYVQGTYSDKSFVNIINIRKFIPLCAAKLGKTDKICEITLEKRTK